jgi:hypothetical protein
MELLGESPPEHGLLGRVLILVLHCAGLTLYAWLVFGGPASLQERAALATGALPIPLTCAYLAESLRRFECWAWFALMFILCPSVLWLAAAILVDTPARQVPVMAWFMAPMVGLTHDLWSRRRQFWADPPVYASRRPARRWVTPEWRAARLAQIAAGAAGPSAVRVGAVPHAPRRELAREHLAPGG